MSNTAVVVVLTNDGRWGKGFDFGSAIQRAEVKRGTLVYAKVIIVKRKEDYDAVNVTGYGGIEYPHDAESYSLGSFMQ